MLTLLGEMAGESASNRGQSATMATASVGYRLSQGLLLFLGACFMVQMFSPLRLTNDAITLLSMGESAAHGSGFLDAGQKTVFPPGYPALLAILLRTGWAHPWVIVGLNMVFLLVGLVAARFILIREFFEDKALVLIICSLFLLSYVVIKESTIPLTDVPFFCLSMSCIAVMSGAKNGELNWRLGVAVGGAALLAVAAMTVRTIGAALLPALLFRVVRNSQFVSWVRRLPLRAKMLIVLGGTFLGGAAVLMLVRTPYWQFFVGGKNVEGSASILLALSYRLAELGELFGNVPLSRMPTNLHVVVPWLGLLLFLLTILGLGAKRKKIGPAEIFLVCYMAALVAWPFHDARYWLPVLPLIMGYSVLALRRLAFPKFLITTYCVVFTILGFATIAYSTRISLAGSNSLSSMAIGA